ncbi:MAG: phosphotransferase enzyme family protein [Propionibacteriaceae bacterium]
MLEQTTPGTPTPDLLAETFGLESISPDSLTRFATVHRARTTDRTEVVVKRAGTEPARVAAMAAWTTALAGAGLGVVRPAPLPVANPQQLGDDWWVVYPWIDGEAYTAQPEQVAAAGDLLGRMHAASVPATDLRPYAWTEADESELRDDLETLDPILTEHGGSAATVRTLGERWWNESLPLLREHDQDLVRCGVSSDYKANNLVFTDTGPVLVDPDNGGLEPRLFDLALAVALFHNECDGAPGRLFTPVEWETFAAAYGEHVTLTPAERDLWPAAVDHMLWEEGSWALEDNDAEAWADPRQRAFLLALSEASPTDFPLPA